jgi:branched-chain amino acid transport system ATP-binding protein
MALLEVKQLSIHFGGVKAVQNVSFNIDAGIVYAVIGPNGAGKTTVFNCISGFYTPSSGNINLEGQRIDGLGSHSVARKGIVRTFQNVRLFKTMTALENLLVAQHQHHKASVLAGLFNTASYRKQEQESIERAMHWLRYMGIAEFANRQAGNLAYGHQRRLEIARCMITEPKLLMLDEPAAGLNPQEKKDLQQLIGRLRDEYGVTILLIEHDMGLVMGVSERILVMEYGRPIAVGLPEEIQNNEQVIKAYLGEA